MASDAKDADIKRSNTFRYDVTEPDISESYTYDRAGNRVSRMTDRGIMESYRYNEVNELLSVRCSRGDGGVNEVREHDF